MGPTVTSPPDASSSFSTGANKLAIRLRLHGHVLLTIAALIWAKPAPVSLLIGGGGVLVGLALRVWASGLLEKGGELCTDGPYCYVRHPLYLGSMLAAVGFAVMMNVIWGWIVVLPLFALLYTSQVIIEERHLRTTYGEAHASYAARVPMLLPWRGPAGESAARGWRLAQLLRNREHYHVVFTLAIGILLALKWRIGS